MAAVGATSAFNNGFFTLHSFVPLQKIENGQRRYSRQTFAGWLEQ
jgi:hypothetical protein